MPDNVEVVVPPAIQEAHDLQAAADAKVKAVFASATPAAESAAPVAPEPAAPQSEEPKASAFAALSRKERQIRAKMERLEAEKQAQLAREESLKLYANKIAEYDRIEALLKGGKSLEALEALGISFEDVAKAKLSNGAPDPVAVAKAEIERFRAEFQKEHKLEQEAANKAAAQREYEAQKNQALNTIRSLAADGDDYELIRAQGAEEMVLDVMEETYKLTKAVPTYADAMAKTEEYLFEQTKKILANSKKFAGVTPASPAAPTQAAPAPAAQGSSNVNADLVSRIQAHRQLGPANKVRTLSPSLAKSQASAIGAAPLSRDALIAKAVREALGK